ncbi:aminoglycoside phosphotransferase family protein [Shinella zoogloeoides]|uniref:aminoglycoside phosphotransferase family protein n=1 Tax=Shinella zoogloeoides TaxID=352475 RepID=UPI00273F3FBA|nr:aminoglycoside phosphotransferase family protein [Shinella zoogloeoides]WLR94764.1 aminoglycoside phosphotransferase family protein [Shinella zoogloeoides]
MFEPYLHRWHLVPDGDPIETHTSSLLPVRQAGRKAMLKLARADEERRGGSLMAWWAGVGAAPVLAHAGEALLMERADGEQSLSQMARAGRDEEACRILCATAWRLHAPRRQPLPDLVPLAQIFRALEPAARTHGGILERCAKAADLLLATPKDIVVLHGDLHHENVLDFGDRGWLAIDPKGLHGERGFDFANIFTNPDLSDARIPVATDPQRFARRLAVVCEAASLDRERLLLWILAWCGLSWAWFIEDGDPAPINRAVAELAAAQLAL